MRELTSDERFDILCEKFPQEEFSKLKQHALNCRTVGEAVKSISDPAESTLSADASNLLKYIFSGERYDALTLLYRYEKERESYIRLMQAVRAAAISDLCSADNDSSALHTAKIIDIIDKIVFSASQNAALSLLSCAAADRLIEAAMSA